MKTLRPIFKTNTIIYDLKIASQCYQCTYNENEQNIDCVNAETNLQNCTTENEENHGKK